MTHGKERKSDAGRWGLTACGPLPTPLPRPLPLFGWRAHLSGGCIGMIDVRDVAAAHGSPPPPPHTSVSSNTHTHKHP